MKSTKIVLALWLGASAWAQTLPEKQVTPPAKAKPTAAQTAWSSPSGPSSETPQASGRKHSRREKVAHGFISAKAATAADGRSSSIAKKGRRDPFISPVVERMRNASACIGGGKRCLAVGEITLQGIVHSPNGSIAVVVNGEHTYFLRENDPLADGAVERITKDAIILRERSSDALGRPFTREVTKKLGVPAV